MLFWLYSKQYWEQKKNSNLASCSKKYLFLKGKIVSQLKQLSKLTAYSSNGLGHFVKQSLDSSQKGVPQFFLISDCLLGEAIRAEK